MKDAIKELGMCQGRGQGDRKIYWAGRGIPATPIAPPQIISPRNFRVEKEDIIRYRDAVREIYGFADGYVIGSKEGQDPSVTRYAIQLYSIDIDI